MPRSYPAEFRRKVLDPVEAGRPVAEIARQLGFTGQTNQRPQRRPNRRTPTGDNSFESSERPAAADSSTNIDESPDQPRQSFGHPQGRC